MPSVDLTPVGRLFISPHKSVKPYWEENCSRTEAGLQTLVSAAEDEPSTELSFLLLVNGLSPEVPGPLGPDQPVLLRTYWPQW